MVLTLWFPVLLIGSFVVLDYIITLRGTSSSSSTTTSTSERRGLTECLPRTVLQVIHPPPGELSHPHRAIAAARPDDICIATPGLGPIEVRACRSTHYSTPSSIHRFSSSNHQFISFHPPFLFLHLPFPLSVIPLTSSPVRISFHIPFTHLHRKMYQDLPRIQS
ncbi:hypothetical protein EDB19DRAFT_457492 [Suillus lakei]|nr:hypothetical protein EDB19DRAFT_457492 [Suillus lakei]